MIVELFISLFYGIAKWLITIAGVLPSMPSAITTVADEIIDYAETGFGFVHMVLGKPLTLAILGLALAYMSYMTIWKVIVWAYVRIRG